METIANQSGRVESIRVWLAQCRAFAQRYFREMLRSKVGIFWSFAFPVIWYGLTIYLNAMPAVPAGEESTLKAILGISFGIFGAFTVTLVGFTGHLAVDIDRKRYRKFRSLPIAPSADLAGRFVAGAALGSGAWLLTVAVAALDGAMFRVATSQQLIGIGLAVGLFCLIGMIAGLLLTLAVPQPEHATTAGTGILVIGFFVTGYNGTVTRVFPARAELLNIIPNSLATRLTVFYMVDTSWHEAGLAPPAMPHSLDSLLLLGIYALGLSVIAVIVMQHWIYGTDVGE